MGRIIDAIVRAIDQRTQGLKDYAEGSHMKAFKEGYLVGLNRVDKEMERRGCPPHPTPERRSDGSPTPMD